MLSKVIFHNGQAKTEHYDTGNFLAIMT